MHAKPIAHVLLDLSICSLLGAAANQAVAAQPTLFPELAPARVLNDSNHADGRPAGTRFPRSPTRFLADVAAARDALHRGGCDAAMPLLLAATRAFEDNGNLWGLLGMCHMKTGSHAAAAQDLQRALALGVRPSDPDLDFNPNDLMVQIAAAYAGAGNTTQTLAWLQRALAARFDERPDLLTMPEFAAMRNDQAFQQLAGAPPASVRSRDAQWRYDIAFLRRQIELLHAAPTIRTPAARLDAMFAQLSADVPRLRDEQITARIDLIVGALGTGHDLFFPGEGKRGVMLPFAIKLYWFTDGLYIIDASDARLIGARVDAFGDVPAADAYRLVAAAFPGDNEMGARWMSVRHLSQAYTLEALGIVADARMATLRITHATGAIETVAPERRLFTDSFQALKAPAGSSAPLYLSRPDEQFWFEVMPSHETLYVQIKTIGDTNSEAFATFVDRLGSAASSPDISHLVLDLRNSPGGNGYLTGPLLRELLRFDGNHRGKALFVLIGRNTFSASQNLITDLDRMARVTFVGEPSGSRPNALGENGRFVLPFSRLGGTLSSQLHMHSWPEDHRQWIVPDMPVFLSSRDFFSGKDPVLEAVVAVIESTAPQGQVVSGDRAAETDPRRSAPER